MVPDRDMAKNPTMGTVPRTTSPTWGYENLIYLGLTHGYMVKLQSKLGKRSRVHGNYVSNISKIKILSIRQKFTSF